MAKKEVDNTAIERLISHWKSIAEDYRSELSNIDKRMTRLRNKAEKDIVNFRDSEHVSYKVTPRVFEQAQKGDLLKAQGALHLASYKAQELSAGFKTKYNPGAIECLNDNNVICNELYTKFTTDSSVNVLIGSNAAIERYYNAVAMEVIELSNYITTNKKIIDELSQFVEEQLYALSRVDGVLKYHNSLNTAEAMNRANRGIIG